MRSTLSPGLVGFTRQNRAHLFANKIYNMSVICYIYFCSGAARVLYGFSREMALEMEKTEKQTVDTVPCTRYITLQQHRSRIRTKSKLLWQIIIFIRLTFQEQTRTHTHTSSRTLCRRYVSVVPPDICKSELFTMQTWCMNYRRSTAVCTHVQDLNFKWNGNNILVNFDERAREPASGKETITITSFLTFMKQYTILRFTNICISNRQPTSSTIFANVLNMEILDLISAGCW